MSDLKKSPWICISICVTIIEPSAKIIFHMRLCNKHRISLLSQKQ